MNVVATYNRLSRPLTDPVLDDVGGNALDVRVYSGDYCDPMFGNWFAPPWPRVVLRAKLRWMPFVSWRVEALGWAWLGYVGFKLYGVDSPEYRNWLPDADVYDGSRATCFSVRPFQFRKMGA